MFDAARKTLDLERGIRGYFLLGDIMAVTFIGALVAFLVALIVSPAWPMLLALPIGMVAGMFLSLIVGMLLFFRYFGAMEVMMPVMLTGMLVGMIIAMAASMADLSLLAVIVMGALIGFWTLISTYCANYLINGRWPL